MGIQSFIGYELFYICCIDGMEDIKLILKCFCILPLLLLSIPVWANTEKMAVQVAVPVLSESDSPAVETGSLATEREGLSVAGGKISKGRIHIVDEPYLLMFEENKQLRDKLDEADVQIKGMKGEVDELKLQLVKMNEKIAFLRQETVVEKTPGAGVAEVATQVDDKLYKIIDGKIDENTLRGWKTFRGIGACTSCHGPTGRGGVGKDLLVTIKEKNREFFKKIIANGKKSTQMIPYKGNKAVMDNLDNIYAYFKARADGVLGPENLIRFPLGKKE